MFTEKITHPHHPSGDRNIAPVPLLESDRFNAIQVGYNVSDKSYEDAVEAAYQAAALIRECITFSDHSRAQPELTPEWVARGHTTNCHGHSIIASECLEKLGIPHLVGFANQHSFLLMQDEESGRVNLIDTPVEKLCVDITPAIGSVALYDCNADLGDVTYLSGSTVLQLSRFNNKQLALERRPWLSFMSGRGGFYYFKPEEEKDRASQLVLRTYTPEQGREVLLAYDSFIHAISRRDTHRAHGHIQTLDGTYPDIDRRNKLRAPTRLVRALGVAAFTDEALQDITLIENSLRAFTKDLILRLWPADERRRIGAKVKSADIIREALESYDEIYQDRVEANDSTADIEDRIRKAKSQLNLL